MKFSSLSTAGKTSGAFYKLIQRQRPALIPRQNPFLHPGLEAWRRDFKTAEPIDLISLSRRIFESPLRTDLMHRVVRWHRNGLRAGTASSKARGEVAGSSRKIRPQKGTGAARAGSNRAPHRRGGKYDAGLFVRFLKAALASVPNLAITLLRFHRNSVTSPYGQVFRQGGVRTSWPSSRMTRSLWIITRLAVLQAFAKDTLPRSCSF